jgi:tetratricopeptide (TPR) repeat protein
MSSLGAALATQGKIDEAMRLFQDAVRIDPTDAEARANLGEALVHRGRADEAMAHYAEALRLAPESAKVRNSYGASLAALGRAAEAVERTRPRPDRSRDCGGAPHLGVALASLGRRTKPFGTTASRAPSPDWADARYNLGRACSGGEA